MDSFSRMSEYLESFKGFFYFSSDSPDTSLVEGGKKAKSY